MTALRAKTKQAGVARRQVMWSHTIRRPNWNCDVHGGWGSAAVRFVEDAEEPLSAARGLLTGLLLSVLLVWPVVIAIVYWLAGGR
jgi:hypothetical protein